ncbi:hypothetical protein [Pseudomonas putida]|uniref:hypothetical protein n=1 Tax=Pseudomonas putida TaxID=303 RepID=UPI0004632728|nr:hypothetical protein [Pseudomonas putida]
MPTENRSSTIEQHDHIEGIIDMVSVPREIIEFAAGLKWHGYKSGTDQKDDQLQALNKLRTILAAPAPQPHPEPIAWMVGTAFWWTKEEAERDVAATGLPIVGLGPMSGAAPAEQRQGEPVAAKGATFMGEPNFQHSIEWYREGISKHWKKICNLRAEVERLRAALKFYADREHYHFESGNWDTVSGEPLNILWRGEEPDFIEDGTVARAALERQS